MTTVYRAMISTYAFPDWFDDIPIASRGVPLFLTLDKARGAARVKRSVFQQHAELDKFAYAYYKILAYQYEDEVIWESETCVEEGVI